ncbi:MAG: hypothetical protein J7J65_08470 [Candidatus Korarchaeota archaeon]|nr:hypothetical protein [Candidatus Korarchaeota archaeon]
MQIPYLSEVLRIIIAWIPKLAAAIVVLVIGWAAGRAFGKAVAYVLDKIGVDDILRSTSVGKSIEERTHVKLTTIFDVIARWFVYLIAISTASDILGVAALTQIIRNILAYLPYLAAGIAIIIVGLVAGDFLGDIIIDVGKKQGIEWADVIGNLFKVFIYLVALLIGLRQMMIDVTLLEVIIQYFAIGVAVGGAVGLGIALGWGLKDIVKKYAEEKYAEQKKE